MAVPSPLPARKLSEEVDLPTVFAGLVARRADVFWLDAGDGAASGWSYLGVGESDADGPGETKITVAAAQPPFCGGWVGWCDYESGAAAAGAPTAQHGGGTSWLRVTAALAVDHRTGDVWALGEELPRVSEQRPQAMPAPAAALARHAPAEYAELVSRCREAIRRGDAYLLCLTTRFTVPGTHDAAGAYLRLRAAHPSHHGGFLRIGDHALLSASPEQFLAVAEGKVSTRPIKGTRPRDTDPARDAALARELRDDPKERAENVMIVDLMRNDLSRIGVPGSLRVDELLEVESYSAVHQLVSTVSVDVLPGVTVGELLAVAFPAGSMTGAPKVSAMTILHDLEGGRRRGVYSGCFGWVGVDGALDLGMVIRSIVIDADAAVVGAGGGITWTSRVEAEVAEVAIKAKAPLAALGAQLPEEWATR